MPDHKRRLFGSMRLPTTVREDLAPGLDFEKPLFIAGVISQAKASGPEICSDGLGVALLEQAMGNEGFGFKFGGYAREEGGDGRLIKWHWL